MNFEKFEEIFDSVKACKPLWLEGEMEPLATDEEIANVEMQLGFPLPMQYKEFLQSIGSGYFGFTNIFSTNPEGEWYLLDKLSQFSFPEGFIPITDDETGGYFGFMVKDNNCAEGIYYLHLDDGEIALKFPTFLDYVAKEGLKFSCVVVL